MRHSSIRKPATLSTAHYAVQAKNESARFFTTQLLCFGSAKSRDAYCQSKAGAMVIAATELARLAALGDWQPRICPVRGSLFRAMPVSVLGGDGGAA